MLKIPLIGETGPGRVSPELALMARDMNDQLITADQAAFTAGEQIHAGITAEALNIPPVPQEALNYVRPNLDKVVELDNRAAAPKVEHVIPQQPVVQTVAEENAAATTPYVTAQSADEQAEQADRLAQVRAFAAATYQDIDNGVK